MPGLHARLGGGAGRGDAGRGGAAASWRRSTSAKRGPGDVLLFRWRAQPAGQACRDPDRDGPLHPRPAGRGGGDRVAVALVAAADRLCLLVSGSDRLDGDTRSPGGGRGGRLRCSGRSAPIVGARRRRARRLRRRPARCSATTASARARGSPTSTSQTSREGAAIPRVYGRVRIAGQVIWATRFEEVVSESRDGGKGGASGYDDAHLFLLRQFRRRPLRGADRAHRPRLGGRQAVRPVELHLPASIPATRRRTIDSLIEAKQGDGAGLSRHGDDRLRAAAARGFRQPHPAALLRGDPPGRRRRAATSAR